MINCFQFKTMNVLDHGKMVNDYFRDLLKYINNEQCQYNWDIPIEIKDKLFYIWINNLFLPIEYINDYQVYHDCGKFRSLYIDEKGQHFPNHEIHSRDVWNECNGNKLVSYLIEMDMYFHKTKPSDIQIIKYSPILLLTAWSEIHANSEMFGGINSTSFKIKRKQLIKATNKIYTLLV